MIPSGSTSTSPKPRASLMTTPLRPPSRTIRLEAAPITVTGISRGRPRMKSHRSSTSAGRSRNSAGPPTRNHVIGANASWLPSAARASPGLCLPSSPHPRRFAPAPATRPICCGSAAAHWVMLPAPRQTTKSPWRAMACTISGRCQGSAIDTTERWPRARKPSTSASLSTPSIGCSPAAYTSATMTVPASFMQAQNSSNRLCRRVKRCGCTTATTSRAPAWRAAFSTAAISTG